MSTSANQEHVFYRQGVGRMISIKNSRTRTADLVSLGEILYIGLFVRRNDKK